MVPVESTGFDEMVRLSELFGVTVTGGEPLELLRGPASQLERDISARDGGPGIIALGKTLHGRPGGSRRW